jgi:hypothetical protein
MLVNQNKEFAPDSFEYFNNPIIDQAKESFNSNAKKQKEKTTDFSLEMNIDEIFDFNKIDKEIEEAIKTTEKKKGKELESYKKEDEVNQLYLQLEETILIHNGWKRQYKVMNSQNKFHKQEVIKQNKIIEEIERMIGDLQQEKIQQSTTFGRRI